MSSDQKQNVIAKTSEEERATLEERANLTLFESTNSDDVEKKIPASIPSIQAAETGKQTKIVLCLLNSYTLFCSCLFTHFRP